MSAPQSKKDEISPETLAALRAQIIPETNDDDFEKPAGKVNRPLVWVSPMTKAAIEISKEAVRKMKEKK